MTIGAFLTAAKEVVCIAAAKAVEGFLALSLTEVAKVGILVGAAAVTVYGVYKFFKNKKKVMNDENQKNPYEKVRDVDYADVRNQKQLHPTVKKAVKKAFKKELKPRYNSKYKISKKARKALKKSKNHFGMSFAQFLNSREAELHKEETFQTVQDILNAHLRQKQIDDYRDAHPTGHELVDWIHSPACFGGLYNPE